MEGFVKILINGSRGLAKQIKIDAACLFSQSYLKMALKVEQQSYSSDMNETTIGFQTTANSLTQEAQHYRCQIPKGWRQGRTLYGGMTAALSLAAARNQFPDLPPFRSANINFIGPVSADPQFSSRLLRQGRNVTSVITDSHVEDHCVASSTFLFGALRPSSISVTLPAPDAPPPEACEAFTPPGAESFVPAFFNRFETRLIAGGRPMSGHDEGYIRVWSRHKDPKSREGITSLLTIGDVLPPAAISLFKTMGPVSSVNWIFTTFTDAPETDDGWWHLESKLSAAQGGYSSQVMRIWNSAGDLVAEGMQCVAIFI